MISQNAKVENFQNFFNIDVSKHRTRVKKYIMETSNEN